MKVYVKIEASVEVEAPNGEVAMDAVERGQVDVNPVVLICCPEIGTGRLVSVRSVRWGDDQ